jgi:retron-type reverse transcriptase
MKRTRSRAALGAGLVEAIEGLQEISRLSPIAATVNPYQADAGAVFLPAIDELADACWQTLLDLQTGLDPERLLYNAWAVGTPWPVALALLLRGALRSGDAGARQAVGYLVGLPASPVSAHPLADWLCVLDGPPRRDPPDLGSVTGFAPGVRLRYSIAAAWYFDPEPQDLIQAAVDQPNCTDWLRRRELLAAFTTPLPEGGRLRRLSESAFFLLSREAQTLLLSDARLLDQVLPESLRQATDLAVQVRRSREAQGKLVEVLKKLRRALEARDFRAVARGARALEERTDDVYVIHHVTQVMAGLSLDAAPVGVLADAGTPPPWRLMHYEVIRTLERLMPRLEIPRWWTESPRAIAIELAEGRLEAATIPAADLHRIGLAWNHWDANRVATAGLGPLIPASAGWWRGASLDRFFKAVDQHAEAKALVERRLSWRYDPKALLGLLADPQRGRRIAWHLAQSLEHSLERTSETLLDLMPQFGTPLWRKAWQVLSSAARWPLVPAAIEFLKTEGTPVDRNAFVHALAAAILAIGPIEKRVERALELIGIEPHAIELFARALSPEGFRLLLRGLPNLAVIGAIEPALSAGQAEDLWHARVARAERGESLRDLLLAGALEHRLPQWRDVWLSNPRGRAHLCALVLAARRSVRNLRKIAARADGQALEVALRDAAQRLPASASREAAFLQLLSHLGMPCVAHLAAVMAQMDREASAGHKLDAAYLVWQLPKRSGGNRTISAPGHSLKFVQRQILAHLLEPLGSHPAAWGFVRGRSIVGNASLHVGQAIVTNADIRNCFPSVRWSLVLAALRRDFGAQLLPATISLLVDICTAQGGLPIGAPTSPALLNRVLVKTDTILQAAAERRGCRYSRYADDLTFSGDHGAVQLIGLARRTLGQIDLALDPKKTNIYRRGRRQIVTGLVVNERVSMPRRLRRRVRAAVHALEQGKLPRWHDRDESPAALAGRVAFMNAVNPQQAEPLARRLKALRGLKKTGEPQ